MTYVEEMVNEFLPKLRGHVVAKYGWIERRGNCLITIDDLIQVASITLLKHIDKWPRIAASLGMDPEGNNGAFYATLKTDVKFAISKYRARDAHEDDEHDMLGHSFDDLPPLAGEAGENTDEEFRTAIRAPSNMPHWPMTQASVVDYFVFLHKRDKVHIALRYFDELSHATTAELLGIGSAVSTSRMSVVRRGWVDHARNQFTDHAVQMNDGPANIRWEPSEALIAYLRDRHRMDIDEYLGIVTIAFREDVTYLIDILGDGRTTANDARAYQRALSPYQEAQVDKWMNAGMTMKDIAHDLGVAYHHVTSYVRSGRRSVDAA